MRHFESISYRIALSFLILGMLLVAGVAVAASGDLATELRSLASGDRSQVQRSVTRLGAGGAPRALVVLEALDQKRLVFDGNDTALILVDNGHVDALTGAAAQPSGETRRAKINNSLRRVLRPAIAQLSLKSESKQIRLRAATDLARRPTEELVPAMRVAMDNEGEAEVIVQLKLGIAQIDAESGEESRRLSGLALLAEEGDVSHQKLVERLSRDSAATPAVRKAAAAALQSILRRAFFASSLANIFYGLSLGSVLLLAALGLAITFGLMNVINMAHGELLMIGAYSTFVVQNVFLAVMPGALDYYLLAAIPVAFACSGAVGLVMERTVLRFLYGRPLETLLATWGISLGLIQTVRLIFGAQNVTVSNPSWLTGGWVLLPTVVLPYSRIATIAFVVLVVAFVWFLLQRTRLGLLVRAVTQNREMAGNLGIPTQQIDMWTFALGSGIAGLGGVALSQLGNVGPELGQAYIVDSFMVVVLGGVGNIWGTVAGAMGLGVVNKLLEPVAGAVLGKIAILILVILFIQKRPQGLFALKGRAAEL